MYEAQHKQYLKVPRAGGGAGTGGVKVTVEDDGFGHPRTKYVGPPDAVRAYTDIHGAPGGGGGAAAVPSAPAHIHYVKDAAGTLVVNPAWAAAHKGAK
jgi:hypothetical protein